MYIKTLSEHIQDLIDDPDNRALQIICMMLQNGYVVLGETNPLWDEAACIEFQEMQPFILHKIVCLELADRTRYKLTDEAQMILREAVG